MKNDTDRSHRTSPGSDPEGHTNRPSPSTLFRLPPEETLMLVEGINSSPPGRERVGDGAGRPNATDMASQQHGEREVTPQTELLSQFHNRGLSQPVVPRLARRRLGLVAFVLLEALRELEPGWEDETNYTRLMIITGFHSKTTISKALRELETLGVIKTRKLRAGGKVTGLCLRYLGVPPEIPEPARKTYIDHSRHELEKLSLRMGRVQRDIDHLERIGVIQNPNNGEAA